MRPIARLFRSSGKKLVPFITAGFPTLESTVPLVLAAEEAGADMVELGMPFSDPLADGPVIQQTSQTALANGANIAWILDTVARIRERSSIPIVLMGYVNPLLSMGYATFLDRAREVGVNGLIIPDLPPDEDAGFFQQARSAGLSTIFLVAPNTPDERISQLGRKSEDLLYAVSILGVTGSSLAERQQLDHYLDRVRSASEVPFVVGFGISTDDDARRIAAKADGIVVGSALLTRLQQATDPAAEAKKYLQMLATAAHADVSDSQQGDHS